MSFLNIVLILLKYCTITSYIHLKGGVQNILDESPGVLIINSDK